MSFTTTSSTMTVRPDCWQMRSKRAGLVTSPEISNEKGSMPYHNAVIGQVRGFLRNDVMDRLGLAVASTVVVTPSVPQGVSLRDPTLITTSLMVWGVYDILYNQLVMNTPKRWSSGIPVAVLSPYMASNFLAGLSELSMADGAGLMNAAMIGVTTVGTSAAILMAAGTFTNNVAA